MSGRSNSPSLAASSSSRELLLSRLRCPDCFGESVREEPAVAEDKGPEQSIRLICDECGRVLQMTGNLLHALPTEMADGGAANLEYFDQISEAEKNHLSIRSRTRNHQIKTDIVVDALCLASSQTETGVTLEIGAGNGAHGAAIVRTGSAYVGLDISTGFLAHAPQHYPELRDAGLAAGDATRIPFRAEVFDRVFCVATLHHLPEPEQGINEAFRVLKPNGRFCFVEPKRFYPSQFIQALRYPETEVSAMKMSVDRMTRWIRTAGAREVEVSFGVYTPNGPAALEPLWDKIDALCRRTPMLHTLSVMFCLHGRK